jgi:hypothetical protein
MSTSARSGGHALSTGGELTIARKAPVATLQAVSICRGGLGRLRECHSHKGGERYQHWKSAPHLNLLLNRGEYTRGAKVLPPVKALTGIWGCLSMLPGAKNQRKGLPGWEAPGKRNRVRRESRPLMSRRRRAPGTEIFVGVVGCTNGVGTLARRPPGLSPRAWCSHLVRPILG